CRRVDFACMDSPFDVAWPVAGSAGAIGPGPIDGCPALFRNALALDWAATGGTRAGALRRGEPTQRVLYRLRQRRRLEVHRFRLHVDAAVRQPADRLDW